VQSEPRRRFGKATSEQGLTTVYDDLDQAHSFTNNVDLFYSFPSFFKPT